MTAVEKLRKFQELQAAINKLSTLTADVLLEDSEGGRYELVRSYAVGSKTPDPGLILRIRRTR